MRNHHSISLSVFEVQIWYFYHYVSPKYSRVDNPAMHLSDLRLCCSHMAKKKISWCGSNAKQNRQVHWAKGLQWAHRIFQIIEKVCNLNLPTISGERGGSVVECRTPEREVRGSRPTAAVLCPWARHFSPRKYWLITQEAIAPSRHDWKIVDWDVKPQHNQPTNRRYLATHCVNSRGWGFAQ